MVKKACAIGMYDSVYGFGAVGADIMAVSTEQECIAALDKVYKSDYGVIFITDDFAPLESVKKITSSQPIPAVLVIPSAKGNTGYAKTELHKMVEKAAGADILA